MILTYTLQHTTLQFDFIVTKNNPRNLLCLFITLISYQNDKKITPAHFIVYIVVFNLLFQEFLNMKVLVLVAVYPQQWLLVSLLGWWCLWVCY